MHKICRLSNAFIKVINNHKSNRLMKSLSYHTPWNSNKKTSIKDDIRDKLNNSEYLLEGRDENPDQYFLIPNWKLLCREYLTILLINREMYKNSEENNMPFDYYLKPTKKEESNSK